MSETRWCRNCGMKRGDPMTPQFCQGVLSLALPPHDWVQDAPDDAPTEEQDCDHDWEFIGGLANSEGLNGVCRKCGARHHDRETVEHGEDDIVELLREGSTVLDEEFHREALRVTMLEAADEIRRLRRSAPREVGWQPIDSVPRDGRPVLVWLPDPMVNSHVHAATYHPNVTIVGGQFDFDATCPPTHWMPLPDPPVGPPIEP